MKFAKWVYRIAGSYELMMLVPIFFLECIVSQTSLPAISHPEYYYGLAVTSVVWPLAFLVMSSDPQRLRTLIPVTWFEKK